MAGGGIAAHLLLLQPYLLHLRLLRLYLLLQLHPALLMHPTLLMRHDMRDSSNIRG